jgi:hypothetical protein
MASAIRQTPRVQGRDEAAAGMLGGTAEYRGKVTGGKIGRVGVLGHEKEVWWGKTRRRRRDGDLPEVVSEMGRANWGKNNSSHR